MQDQVANAVIDPFSLTVTKKAGRLILAFVLSTTLPPNPQEIQALSGVHRRFFADAVDEVRKIDWSIRPEGLIEHEGDAFVIPGEQESGGIFDPDDLNLLDMSLKETVVQTSLSADASGDNKQQIAAIIKAWEINFPATNQVQSISAKYIKQRKWMSLLGEVSPGHEADTFNGICRGVQDDYLRHREYPLGTMTKIIESEVEKIKSRPQKALATPGYNEITDDWRDYARGLIRDRENGHVDTHFRGGLSRLMGGVSGGTAQPS